MARGTGRSILYVTPLPQVVRQLLSLSLLELEHLSMSQATDEALTPAVWPGGLALPLGISATFQLHIPCSTVNPPFEAPFCWPRRPGRGLGNGVMSAFLLGTAQQPARGFLLNSQWLQCGTPPHCPCRLSPGPEHPKCSLWPSDARTKFPLFKCSAGFLFSWLDTGGQQAQWPGDQHWLTAGTQAGFPFRQCALGCVPRVRPPAP